MDPSSPKKKAKVTMPDHWGKAKPIWERTNAPTSSPKSTVTHDVPSGEVDGAELAHKLSKGTARSNAEGSDSAPKDHGDGKCPSLYLCIDRWSLTGPYRKPTSEEHWAAYYAERDALQWRHDNFFPGDNGEGKELEHYSKCYHFRNCSDDPIDPETADFPEVCSTCKKSRSGAPVKYSDAIKHKWAAHVKSNPTLESVYCGEGSFLANRPPFMKPHCVESYASDCHSSGTPEGEYNALREHIQERIAKTIKTMNLYDEKKRGELGEKIASGLFILGYWANFEECDVGAEVRTVDMSTRLYAPNGSGGSSDLTWYRHFRARDTIADEKYSTLHVRRRALEECDPKHPAASKLSRKNDHFALAVLDGDTSEDGVHKTFPLLDELRSLREVLFEPDQAKTVSPRKVFGLLVRASGAHAVRKEGGWVYSGMRKRYELYPGEESDEEEDGPQDGPSGCCIM